MFGCLQWCQLVTKVDTVLYLFVCCILYELFPTYLHADKLLDPQTVCKHITFFLVRFRMNRNYFSILC